jgi:hypothetical protein
LDRYEANLCSFVIRIWIEEPGDELSNALWRGHITHVLSGKQRYFQELDAIATFISHYLAEMGANVTDR